MSCSYLFSHGLLLKNDIKTLIQTRLLGSPGSGAKLKNKEMDVELNKQITFKETSSKEYLNNFPVIHVYISYTEFFERFIMKNQACLMRCVSTKWEATKKWVAEDSVPNFSYLIDKYGDSCITVHDCNVKYDYCTTKPLKWKLQQYANYWKDYIDNGYPKDKPVYYLKDWHLKSQNSNDNFYEVPLQFASDWLNEYLVDTGKDDYRFVYMGVKGSWSPFHVDVMTSYSWSTNICGQKRWVLFPPGEEQHLGDRLGNLPHDIMNVKHTRKSFEVLQKPGDAIFVPSNWHHQVWNTKNTISINHNWVNGGNLHNVWQSMEKNLLEVKQEIQDCNDMDDFLHHCQVMLRASFGMNFRNFYEFLSHIALKRINLLRNGIAITLQENRTLGRNHALFDLQAIRHTLLKFTQHEDLMKIGHFKTGETKPLVLLQDIENIIQTVSKDSSS